MGYRNIKPCLEIFGDFVSSEKKNGCGLYKNIKENGGRGCRSRSKLKSNDECHAYDCPLCYTVDLTDLRIYNVKLYQEWKELIEKKGYKEEQFCDTKEYIGSLEEFFGCPWVIVLREII